jgi:CHAD domain-containing protein
MEIEAKFSIPDLKTFEKLQEVHELVGANIDHPFVLSANQTKSVQDVYLDTLNRALLAQGYACRERVSDGSMWITLKSLGDVEGAVHKREELEVEVPDDATAWPESSVHNRVCELIGSVPLFSLFTLEQARTTRWVQQAGQAVNAAHPADANHSIAELSLDAVHLTMGDQTQCYYVLEIELMPDALEDTTSERALRSISEYIREVWQLQPDPKSKFERGLAFVDHPSHSGDAVLTLREQTILKHIADQDDMYGRRARALLALNEGRTQKESVTFADLSERRIRYWLAEFRERQLAIFPDHILLQVPFLRVKRPCVEEKNEPQSRSATRAKMKEEADVKSVPQPQPASTSEPAGGDHLMEDLLVAAPEAGKSPPVSLPKAPDLHPDDSMAEAARKTLCFHFQRMLFHEPGTRLGKDIEELHDMRVATRRMRAAVRVFDGYLNAKQMRPYVKGMRRTGRALGTVRDLDVFWDKTQKYLDAQPEGQRPDLDPLRDAWETERDRARERMLTMLDSQKYVRFKTSFAELLQASGSLDSGIHTSKKGEPLPYRVRHVVPIVVYQRLAAVRAYDEWMNQPEVSLPRYHQLRIATKRLRYTLEFFQDVLTPETKDVIKALKGLQDHLGDLQDAVVASNLLRDFLVWGTWGYQDDDADWPEQPVVAPGVAAYLTARQVEIQEKLQTFPPLWRRFQSSDFNQRIASLIELL